MRPGLCVHACSWAVLTTDGQLAVVKTLSQGTLFACVLKSWGSFSRNYTLLIHGHLLCMVGMSKRHVCRYRMWEK